MTDAVPLDRACSRATCAKPAAFTLTYDYADSLAVLGPLSPRAEPHAYDLCRNHAAGLSVPLGWTVMRHEGMPGLDLPN